jgi:hypothetical protein
MEVLMPCCILRRYSFARKSFGICRHLFFSYYPVVVSTEAILFPRGIMDRRISLADCLLLSARILPATPPFLLSSRFHAAVFPILTVPRGEGRFGLEARSSAYLKTNSIQES